jgi:hypothetical protein
MHTKLGSKIVRTLRTKTRVLEKSYMWLLKMMPPTLNKWYGGATEAPWRMEQRSWLCFSAVLNCICGPGSSQYLIAMRCGCHVEACWYLWAGAVWGRWTCWWLAVCHGWAVLLSEVSSQPVSLSCPLLLKKTHPPLLLVCCFFAAASSVVLFSLSRVSFVGTTSLELQQQLSQLFLHVFIYAA